LRVTHLEIIAARQFTAHGEKIVLALREVTASSRTTAMRPVIFVASRKKRRGNACCCLQAA
jgi:hypothetical protein